MASPSHLLSQWEIPSAVSTPEPNELHIWRASLTHDADALARMASLLSPDEVERAGRYAFARDRDRFVAARAILRCILAACTGGAPQAVALAYGPYGKPELRHQPGETGLCFYLAHSGTLALYALAWRRRVGIDVEQVRSSLEARPLLAQIFSLAEQEQFAPLSDAAARQAFFRAWVCKEAFIKAIGKGLSFPPEQVEIALAPDGGATLLPVAGHASAWGLHMIGCEDGFSAAAVVEGEAVQVRLYSYRPDLMDGGYDPGTATVAPRQV